MELRSRDLAILETVGELGTADTEIIHRLFFPEKTVSACQQRLRKIVGEGLLWPRRLIAIDGDMRSGSLPMLYFLTNLGADLVEREIGTRPRRVTRSDPKQLTLRHRMDAVRARLAIDQAAEQAAIATLEWIMEQDTRGGGTARKGRSPSESLILRNHYERGGRTVGFRPDASCRLQLPYKERMESLIAYIEVDRSTEGHGQFERKLPGIEAFLSDGGEGWRSHWPTVTKATIRIFVLCKSKERLTNLSTIIKGSLAADTLRFAIYPLDPGTVLTEEVWSDCEGKMYRIIPNQK